MRSFGIKELLDDLIRFQDNTTIDPTRSYPYSIKTKFNFNDVIKFSSKLKKQNNEIVIKEKIIITIFLNGAKKLYGGVEELQQIKLNLN